MPTYQYECSQCGHGFEIFQSMTEKRLQNCPQCRQESLQRLIGTGSGIIFKGSGFYQTDYKNKTAPQAAPLKEKSSDSPCANSCPHADTCSSAPKKTP